MESVEVESTRLLSFSVKVGEGHLWETVHEVTLGEYAAPPPDNLGTPKHAGTYYPSQLDLFSWILFCSSSNPFQVL